MKWSRGRGRRRAPDCASSHRRTLRESSRSAWSRTALAEVAPYESAGRYVNDVAEVGDGLARTIYGDAKYERLVALKRQWDPDNVFRLNQNIRP